MDTLDGQLEQQQQQKYNNKTLLQFYWRLVIRHKYKCLSMSSLGVLWGFTEAYAPYYLKILVDLMSGYAGSPEQVYSVFFWPAVYLISIISIKHIIYRVTDILTEGYIIPEIQADIRSSMLNYSMGHSYYYFQKKLSGSIANRINTVSDCFEDIYDAWEHWVFPVLCSFGFSLYLLYRTHPTSALMFFLWMIGTVVISMVLVVKSKDLVKKRAKSLHRVIGTLVNILQNIFTVKMFAQTERELDYFASYQEKEIRSVRKLEWFVTFVRTILSLSCIGLFAGATVFLLKTWQMGEISGGDVVFVLTTCLQMMNTIWWLSGYMGKIYKRLGIAGQSFGVMRRIHGIQDKKYAKKLKVPNGEIEFQDVSFAYKNKDDLFSNISTKIKAGERVGLVGFSGSGKTTFIHLIMRFFDIQSGKILIDGTDISKVRQNSLREHISLIPQEPLLFARSLRENIVYGKPDASDKEVIKACEKARAHEFITRMPDSYDSYAGERGVSLSGGQRQRIAIARAILKEAPILILDEATSALDSITEKKIQESVDELMIGRTTIVVAHRLSTLQNMDRILVFDQGKIIEEGSHKSLLRKKGHYAKLWNLQVGGFLPEKDPDVFEAQLNETEEHEVEQEESELTERLDQDSKE